MIASSAATLEWPYLKKGRQGSSSVRGLASGVVGGAPIASVDEMYINFLIPACAPASANLLEYINMLLHKAVS